jgi:hypothetical protein
MLSSCRQVPVTAPGSVHALLLWWQLGMTREAAGEGGGEAQVSATWS